MFSASSCLVGCAALGLFDSSQFIDAVNKGECEKAQLQLTGIMPSALAELEYRGVYEVHCGDKAAGQYYLSEAARRGSSYARRSLVRYGMPLPGPSTATFGGSSNTIDIYIHR